MTTLSPTARRQLERAVADARDVAEEAARAALQTLAVGDRDPYEHWHGMLFACFAHRMLPQVFRPNLPVLEQGTAGLGFVRVRGRGAHDEHHRPTIA